MRICPHTQLIVDRAYLLIGTQGSTLQLAAQPRIARRHFLLDIGASLWHEGLGGSSQDWLISAYGARSVQFDRILLWEATTYTPDQLFKDVPKDAMHAYQYLNVAATAGEACAAE